MRACASVQLLDNHVMGEVMAGWLAGWLGYRKSRQPEASN